MAQQTCAVRLRVGWHIVDGQEFVDTFAHQLDESCVLGRQH